MSADLQPLAGTRERSRGVASVLQGIVQNKSEYVSLGLLITICLVIGLMTLKGYGVSWDEPNVYDYARYALHAYRYFLDPLSLPLFQKSMDSYGPAYFMAAAIFARVVQAVVPAWAGYPAWHLFYFLTFLAGVVFLYLLLRRSLGVAGSLGACLLFVTQPLLWGHAFMNPKDLPFMVFFLASMYLGLQMVDHCSSSRPNYVLVAIAGISLGLTISIRSPAPLAGILIGIYAFWKCHRKAVPLLGIYALLAGVTAYLTWPFLWAAPLQNFFKSLGAMSMYPYSRAILLMGRYYAPKELPWFYFLLILGIQLTVPVILLALIGLPVAVRRYLGRGEKAREPLLLFLGWFLLPVLELVSFHTTIYDNARQLLFLLPPLFLLIGLSLDAWSARLHSRWWMTGVLLACTIPGVYGAVQLHPYEYIYYNQLVGGVRGAQHNYEMDYWATSYREVVLWLNEYAPRHAALWAGGPTDVLEPYLRPGITISCNTEKDCGGRYDYVALLARWNAEASCPAANTVFSVQRLGVVLAVVKQPGPKMGCQ